MTTTEFCMMLVMLFLTWHLWRMSKRIRELELHDKAQWETISRLWAEIRANRKRIAALEKDGDIVSRCYDCPMNPDGDAWMR